MSDIAQHSRKWALSWARYRERDRLARSMWSCLAKTSIVCNHLAILPLHRYDVESTANDMEKVENRNTRAIYKVRELRGFATEYAKLIRGNW
jgi:hypothetical protein